MKNFDELLEAVEAQPVRKVAVAVGQDPTVIEAVAEAKGRNIAEATLVGDKREIIRLAEAGGVALAERDVLAIAMDARTLRLVTHRDVGDDDCARAVEAIGAALG